MEKDKLINSYFENKISNSLYVKTSNSFSSKMMEKLKMEIQFATEDKKADNVFKSIFIAIIIAIISVSTIAIYSAFQIESESQIGGEQLNTFYTLYNNLSLNFREFFSSTGDLNLLLLIPVVALIFISFNLLDKKFLEKNF